MNNRFCLYLIIGLAIILAAGVSRADDGSMTLVAGQKAPGQVPVGPDTPRQQAYTIDIRGNHHFSKKDLLKSASVELQKFSQRGYRKADIDDASFRMRSAYLQAGFPFAVVDYRYGENTLPVQVSFTVAEGPRVFIGQVIFTGNSNLEEKTLLGLFAGESRPLDRLQKKVFIESDVRDAVNRLRDYYRGEGFRDVEVKSPLLSYTQDRGGVDLTIGIAEGNRYFISEIVFSGDLKPELVPEFEKIKQEFVGKTYYVRRKLLLRSKLEAIYDAVGYAEAGFEVTARSMAEPGSTRLAVEITSGEQIRIAEILISGNQKTKESFIVDNLQFKAGDIFTNAKRKKSFRKLFDSGLFAKVNIELTHAGLEDDRNLEIKVEELPPFEIYLEPGWGSYEELRFGAGLFEKNLFGTGKNGKIDALVSSKGGNLTLSYTDPWFLQTDIAMNVPLYYERREEPSYTSEDTGLAVSFARNLTSSFTLITAYQYKMTQLINPADGSQLQNESVDYNKGTLALQAIWDTRDDIFYPAKGFRLASGLDLSLAELGSEIDFGRLTLGSRYFIELPGEFVFGAQWKTGLIIPLGEQTFIPISERFFNGGDSSVRSYNHSQLGPKDANNEPLGGLGYNVFSLELRKRLFRNFAATFYIDAGNVSPGKIWQENGSTAAATSADLLDDTLDGFFSDFKFGIGVGLQYLLPVGPIRVDVAYNPDPEELWADEDWVFHFSLGMAF